MLATAADVSDGYALIVECSEWLRSKAIPQWNPTYPLQRFERDVAAGEVWIWRGDASVDATVTVSSKRPEYHPAHMWQEKTSAWYICRFAVARALKGTGFGVRVLTELEDAARREGIAALRLDVAAANPFLVSYYEARGFSVTAREEIMGAAAVFLEKYLG